MSTLIRWIKRLESRLAPKTIVTTGNVAISQTDAYQGVVVSNRGAGAEVIVSLPAALPGMRVSGVVQAVQLLSFDPNGTEIIYGTNGASLTAGIPIKGNAAGECIRLVCIERGAWVVEAFNGTWTASAA